MNCLDAISTSDDETAMVDQILSVVDLFDEEEDEACFADSPSFESSEHNAYLASDTSTKKRNGKSLRKRIYKPGYSTEILHRKKAEIKALKAQGPILEGWLACLHRLRANAVAEGPQGAASGGKKSKKYWSDKAMDEFRKRRQAELVNRKLNAIRENQTNVQNSVLTLLQEQSAFEGMQFVLRLRPRHVQANNISIVTEKLAERVPKLHQDCETIFPKDNLPSFGCQVRTRLDERLGKVVEVIGRAPVACSIQEASDMVWEELKFCCKQADRPYHHSMKPRGTDAMSSPLDMALDSRHGPRDVNGVVYLQKFEETDRIVHIWVCELPLVHVKAHIWTIVSKSTVDPSVHCDFQFYAQLTTSNRNQGEELQQIWESIIDPLSLKTRAYSLWLQNTVVEKAEAKM